MKIKNRNQQAIVDWIINSNTTFNYAATLTFPNDVVTKETANKICSQFRNFYNTALGYKNYKRKELKDKSKSAPIISVLESGYSGSNLHYHFALHKPTAMADWQYELMIDKCWSQANFSKYHRSVIKPIDDDGWAEYIVKEVTSTNTDAIDLSNTNIH